MAAHGFADVVLVTDDSIDAHQCVAVPGLRIERIAPLTGRSGYSDYVLRSLAAHIKTSHALVFQWDGFVLDAKRWLDGFLEYDYIGAPLLFDPDFPACRVGNGGFSLRSAKLMQTVASMLPDGGDWHEDKVISKYLRATLEARHGLRFAPVEVARHFSIEHLSSPEARKQEPDMVADETFGFHGFFNFHLACTDDELLALVDSGMGTSRDAVLSSWVAGGLLQNLLLAGRAQVAGQLATRIAPLVGLDPLAGVAWIVARACIDSRNKR